MEFKSEYGIGQKVRIVLDVGGNSVFGYIRTVTFTNCKVRYSIRLKDMESTIHNVDSILIVEGYDEVITFNPDNYS